MKTILQHLKSIKDKKIRKQALNNIDEMNKDSKELLLSKAILGAFVWSESQEGYDYWNNIFNQPTPTK